jgi:hypothetical protein
MVSTSASPEEPGCALAPWPGASTVGVVWASAVPARRQATAVAQKWVLRFDIIGFLQGSYWTARQAVTHDLAKMVWTGRVDINSGVDER